MDPGSGFGRALAVALSGRAAGGRASLVSPDAHHLEERSEGAHFGGGADGTRTYHIRL